LTGPVATLADLQGQADEPLLAADAVRRCPAPGRAVEGSWRDAQPRWQALPLRPGPFDRAGTRRVPPGGTVSFEGRSYSVPVVLCGPLVGLRGCAAVVQVWQGGRVGAGHPRPSQPRVPINPSPYHGPGDERVAQPPPWGRMARKLQEVLEVPVERRPLGPHAARAEAAR
jgi:hypothetical protein